MAAPNPAKVIIGTPEKPARSSFMFCRTLKEPTDEEKAKGATSAKGTCAILFSKKDKKTYKRVLAAIEAAGKKKLGKSFSLGSKRIKTPINCGTELYEDPEYTVGEEAKGMWFISTSCYKIPQLVDENGQRVIDPEEIDRMMSSGNYFLFSVTFKGYNNESKGVRAELSNLMFVKEGDRLDGSASAEDDFAKYAMDNDDDDEEDEDDEDESPRRRKKSSKKKSSRRRSRR